MSEFPHVHDEATPTPPWVPALGATLLAVLVLASIVTKSVREIFAGEGDVAPVVAPREPSPPGDGVPR